MEWERPKTIKLYLHPPEVRKLITIWPDFKIVSSDVDPIKGTGFFNATGIRFLFGEKAIAPDWKKSQFVVRNDGIPVYFLKTSIDDMEYLIECFCTWKEIPETYIRFTVTNASGRKKELITGVMARSGEDRFLYGITGDFYTNYNPLLENWDMVSNDFCLEKNSIKNRKATIFFNAGEKAKLQWIPVNRQNIFAKNYLEIKQTLEPFETISYYFVLAENSDKIPVSASHHSFERNQCVSQWEKELNKVISVPDIRNQDWLIPVLWSLICQCLQMFVKDENSIARPRQGGRWAGVWPVEAMDFLIALDMLGLYDWTEKGYRFFLKHQEKDGENKGRFNSYLAPQWENINGGVLYGLSRHLLLHKNEKCFQEFKKAMLDGFEWIIRRREKSSGLFPAGTPHDWGFTVQAWCITDAVNFMGINEMADAFSYFSDPNAGEIKKQAIDYKNCLEKVLGQIVEKQSKKDEIFIPNYLGIEESYPPQGPYFADGPAMLIRAGILDSKSPVFEKVENYFRNKGWMKNGLTGLMTDGLLGSFHSDPWAGHTWYVSFSDFCWFLGWMKKGKKEQAFETMWAQVRYGMSEHYYMLERFADNDPTFCPWQPNASANGRLIQMLFEFYGARTITKDQQALIRHRGKL